MDYDRPLRISRFVKEVHGGFQLLNLKNDLLRKRFDGIKYDIKKIEEGEFWTVMLRLLTSVVYDITLRGLIKPQETQMQTQMQTQD